MQAGDRFGMLTVVSLEIVGKYRFAECDCDCGGHSRVYASNLGKNTNSCGCLRVELGKLKGEINKKHGMAHSATYRSWTGMKGRCGNKNNADWFNYGGRGITVCPEWVDSFDNFLRDMGERPKGKTLDRIDNSLGYSKSNCKWATNSEQAKNKRPRAEWFGAEEKQKERDKKKEERRRICKTCGTIFYPRMVQIKMGAGVFCSQRCNGHSRIKNKKD